MKYRNVLETGEMDEQPNRKEEKKKFLFYVVLFLRCTFLYNILY